MRVGMAITKSNLTFVLLLMLLVVETKNFSELSVQVIQQDHDEPGLPNRRVKREVQEDKAEYEVDVEVNLTDSRTLENLRNFLRTGQFILTLDPSVNVTQIDLTTVCYINGTDIECRCEDQYVWPSSSCFSYGACDEMTDSTCGCINKVPLDGSFCQPKSVSVYQYRLDIQIYIKDTEQLRSNFANVTFPRQIRSDVNISDAHVTTVCSPAETNIQCRCERNFLWPCDKCATYGKCDEGSACGCIKDVPTDGQFCQSELNNLTVCPSTTLVPSLTFSTDVPTITEETTTPASTVISTAETQTSPTTIFISTTIEAKTNAVSTSTPTITKEPTTAASTLLATTTGPITTANPTVIPTTTEKPTTEVVTVTTIKEPTTAISTDIPTTFVPSVPTTAVTPSTTTSTATTTTSTVPTKTTKVTYNTTETIATTTTAKATITTTTNATTTTTTKATTTTTNKDTTTTTTEATTTATTKATTTTTTKATTTAKTTTIEPTTSTAAFTAIDIAVSVTFDMVFKNEFNDKTSSAYQSLENNITTELKTLYKFVNGFRGVTVTGFRPGSVIADFVIPTSKSFATQITQKNINLRDTLRSIAPVTKVTALYKSSTNIKINSTILTNTTMTLVCGPPEGDLLDIVGNINSAEWKFENINISSRRRPFATHNNTSILTVNNVNPFDAGLYECILKGTNSDFYQNGTVQKDNIQAAPDVKMVLVKNVECIVGNKVPLSCCVQPIYNITWAQPPSSVQISGTTSYPDVNCITNEYTITSCDEISFTCKVNKYDGYEKTTTLKFFTGAPTCQNNIYGDGRGDSIADVLCPAGQEGNKKAICKGKKWELIEDNCILTVINDLFDKSTELVQQNVQNFSSDLQKSVNDSKTEIAKSSTSVSAIVDIITTIANVSTSVTTDVMRNVLQTIDVLADNGVKDSWETLNKDRNNNAGSKLLESLETLSGALSGTADISTERIHLIRTNATNFVTPNSTVSLKISDSDGFFDNDSLMTIIILSTFNNVMPARNSSFDLSHFNETSNQISNPNNANLAINAAVVLVKVNQTVQNVSFEFQTLNATLSQETQCVFWNFTLLENFGAWDDEGCKFVSLKNGTVTCNCNHLTSFSILKSTNQPPGSGSDGPDGPGTGPPGSPLVRLILDIITYIGVGISLASLVICLIIEGYVWKAVTRNSTALMRHISIVNTALSLLIADICFIIAASYSQKALDNKDGDFNVLLGQCSAVTFFMHFFYLALFFWMLVSGLLLFYRTVMVFSHMSKSIMIAMGFVIGYGCPLIIAVTTVAATAPSQTYIRKNYICWLNWTESKALLSLVIPALVIVVVNIIVVIVVLYKMMRRSSGNTIQPDEKNSFVVILRCLAILTPLFGLTWALGIGTMISPKDVGIHIAFAFFNSLQGFFILVFGTLFDSKIRAVLSSRTPCVTRNTSDGTNCGGLIMRRLRSTRVSQTGSSNSGSLHT